MMSKKKCQRERRSMWESKSRREGGAPLSRAGPRKGKECGKGWICSADRKQLTGERGGGGRGGGGVYKQSI